MGDFITGFLILSWRRVGLEDSTGVGDSSFKTNRSFCMFEESGQTMLHHLHITSIEDLLLHYSITHGPLEKRGNI